ncbi:ABC transporter [Clostridia bacterium]|nr:ABC transporter [Clostridia bacterium]
MATEKTQKSGAEKFFIILQKEIREIITPQSLIPIVLIFVLFYFLGDLMKTFTDPETIEIDSGYTQGTQDEPSDSGDVEKPNIAIAQDSVVGIIDLDNSEISRSVTDSLIYYGLYPVLSLETDPQKAFDEMVDKEVNGTNITIKSLAVIPMGFGMNVSNMSNEPIPIDVYTKVDSFGLTSMISGSSTDRIGTAINDIVSNIQFPARVKDTNVSLYSIANPVTQVHHTYLNGKTEKVSASEVQGYVTSQISFVPIIIFLIVMLSTQLLAGSVVNEKADKTLETLMTTPVSRFAVLFAKMVAAAIYAALYAVVYVIGYGNFNKGLTGDTAIFSEEFGKSLENFGVTFSPETFALIGIQLFLSVLCGLAISLFIGMIADDMKSLQSYIAPLMIVIMIPYLITMFVDVNTLPLIARIVLYIIPFSHTFTAATNIFVQNWPMLIGGIIYQAVFVAGMLTFSVKVFNSDMLFTLGSMLKGAGKKKGKSVVND